MSLELQLPVIALAAVTVVAATRLTARWPIEGLTPRQLLGCRLLERTNKGEGLQALTKFYDWRVDRWRKLAAGAALAAGTILVSLVGISLAGATVEHTVAPEGEIVKRTMTDGVFLVPPIALVLFYLGIAVLAWARARAAERRYLEDLYRMS